MFEIKTIKDGVKKLQKQTDQFIDTNMEIGLSEEEAKKRLNEFGANKLTGTKSRSLLQRIFAQINNVLIYVLIVAAVISGILGELADSINNWTCCHYQCGCRGYPGIKSRRSTAGVKKYGSS